MAIVVGLMLTLLQEREEAGISQVLSMLGHIIVRHSLIRTKDLP